MLRLSLLILLLTVVYSFDEFKYTLLVLWRRYRKQKHYHTNRGFETDNLVADLVLLATIPLNLAYLLLGAGSLTQKLLLILLEILLIIILMQLSRRSRNFSDIGLGLLSLVSPSLRIATRTAHATFRISKYLTALLLPLLVGIGLAAAVRHYGPETLQERLDPLLRIAVLGLVLNVTIGFLEKMFRLYRFHLVALMRILLGILIISMLNFQA